MPYQRLLDPSMSLAYGENLENVGGGTGGTSFGATLTNMGYYTGFLPSGTGQTGAGPSILSSVVSGLETFLPAIFGSRGTAIRTPPTLPPATVPVGSTIGSTVASHPVLTTIGAIGAAGATIGAGMQATHIVQGMLGGGRARYAAPGTHGYHMIKKGPHAGQWTRNRHRNVANIRALRRALSRAHGFERICRKVMHFVSPHKSRGRPVFRRRRRKS